MKSYLMFSAVAAAALAAQILAAQSCSVSTLVTVLDRKTNQPIDGLATGDFHAKFQGHEIPMASVKSAPAERRLLFVVDRSASMTESNLHFNYDANHDVNHILKDAFSAIPGTDTVASLAFSGDFSTQTDFMDLSSAIEKMHAVLTWSPAGKGNKRKTALWDNISAALRLLGSPQPGDVIIVVSDGGDNHSKISEETVRNEVLRTGVPVIAMMLELPPGTTLEEQGEASNLIDLADVTGGSATVIDPQTGRPVPNLALGVRPGELIRLLSHQYAVELAIPILPKPEKWQLEVRPANSPKPARVLSSKYLSPCAATR